MQYNFNYSDKRHKRSPLSCDVEKTTKISSFSRSRKINVEDNIDEISYNNNGKRQNSTIPHLEAEEGITLKEEGGQESSKKYRSIRATSASCTRQSFKSYTK